jgi:tetratricopeptide (TPR) repeat protein
MLLQPNRSDAENLIIIDILNQWAKVHYYRGSFVELESLLRSQEKIVELLGNKTQCGMFYAWLGMSLWANGESRGSYNYLKKALSIGETVNSKVIIGYACIWLSFTCADLGNFKEGLFYAQEGHTIAGQIKTDHYLYFKSLFAFSYNYAWMGNPSHFKPIVKELIEYGERKSHVRCLVVAYWSEGHMYASIGDWEAAVNSYQKAVAVAVDPFYHYSSQLMTALRYLQAGMMAEFEAIFPDILKYCDDTGSRFFKDAVDSMSSLLQINNGDLSKGMHKLLEIGKRNIDSELWFQKITVQITISKVYLDVLKQDKQISIFTMIKNPGFILRHVVFAAKKAENHLNEIVTLGLEKHAIGLVAQAKLDLGILYKRMRRYDKAQSNLEEAIRIFDEIGAYTFLNQAKNELSGMP